MKEFTKDNLPEIGEMVECLTHRGFWLERVFIGYNENAKSPFIMRDTIGNSIGLFNRCRPIPKYEPKFGDWVECPDGRIGVVTGEDSYGNCSVHYGGYTSQYAYYNLSKLKPSTQQAWEEQNKNK